MIQSFKYCPSWRELQSKFNELSNYASTKCTWQLLSLSKKISYKYTTGVSSMIWVTIDKTWVINVHHDSDSPTNSL